HGLGDLQEAGLLPGQHWIAFDLTAHVDPSSWWISVITGATELSPRMTVLQVVAWAVYLAAVIPAFLRAGRPATAPPAPEPAGPPGRGWASARWERRAARRPWAVAGVLILVPALVATAAIAVLPSASAAAVTAVTMTGTRCAPDWTSARTGTQTFTVAKKSGQPGEIQLHNAGRGGGAQSADARAR